MAEEKIIGTAKVLTSEMYTRKDGTYGFKCVGICNDDRIIQMYRPGEEEPKKGDEYNMVLGSDNQLRPIVRLVKK